MPMTQTLQTLSMSTRGHSEECPYGADDCPKLKDLAKFDSEIVELRESVASLNMTMKMMTGILTILLCASMGVSLI